MKNKSLLFAAFVACLSSAVFAETTTTIRGDFPEAPWSRWSNACGDPQYSVAATPGDNVYLFFHLAKEDGVTGKIISPMNQDYWKWHLEDNGNNQMQLRGEPLTKRITDGNGSVVSFSLRVVISYKSGCGHGGLL